jgi:hypothetical protein
VVLPARFALAVPSLPPEPLLRAAASAPRGNKLALVLVAGISLVVGGLGVKFAGARAESDATAASATSLSAPSPVAASAAPLGDPADAADAAVVMELPASSPPTSPQAGAAARMTSPGRSARPSEKKKGAPAKGPSSSGRPFMPSDL